MSDRSNKGDTYILSINFILLHYNFVLSCVEVTKCKCY